MTGKLMYNAVKLRFSNGHNYFGHRSSGYLVARDIRPTVCCLETAHAIPAMQTSFDRRHYNSPVIPAEYRTKGIVLGRLITADVGSALHAEIETAFSHAVDRAVFQDSERTILNSPLQFNDEGSRIVEHARAASSIAYMDMYGWRSTHLWGLNQIAEAYGWTSDEGEWSQLSSENNNIIELAIDKEAVTASRLGHKSEKRARSASIAKLAPS